MSHHSTEVFRSEISDHSVAGRICRQERFESFRLVLIERTALKAIAPLAIIAALLLPLQPSFAADEPPTKPPGAPTVVSPANQPGAANPAAPAGQSAELPGPPTVVSPGNQPGAANPAAPAGQSAELPGPPTVVSPGNQPGAATPAAPPGKYIVGADQLFRERAFYERWLEFAPKGVPPDFVAAIKLRLAQLNQLLSGVSPPVDPVPGAPYRDSNPTGPIGPQDAPETNLPDSSTPGALDGLMPDTPAGLRQLRAFYKDWWANLSSPDAELGQGNIPRRFIEEVARGLGSAETKMRESTADPNAANPNESAAAGGEGLNTEVGPMTAGALLQAAITTSTCLAGADSLDSHTAKGKKAIDGCYTAAVGSFGIGAVCGATQLMAANPIGAGLNVGCQAVLSYVACIGNARRGNPVFFNDSAVTECSAQARKGLPETLACLAISLVNPYVGLACGVVAPSLSQFLEAAAEAGDLETRLGSLQPIYDQERTCQFEVALANARELQNPTPSPEVQNLRDFDKMWPHYVENLKRLFPNVQRLIDRLESEAAAAREVARWLKEADDASSDPVLQEYLLNQARAAAGTITCLLKQVAEHTPTGPKTASSADDGSSPPPPPKPPKTASSTGGGSSPPPMPPTTLPPAAACPVQCTYSDGSQPAAISNAGFSAAQIKAMGGVQPAGGTGFCWPYWCKSPGPGSLSIPYINFANNGPAGSNNPVSGKCNASDGRITLVSASCKGSQAASSNACTGTQTRQYICYYDYGLTAAPSDQNCAPNSSGPCDCPTLCTANTSPTVVATIYAKSTPGMASQYAGNCPKGSHVTNYAGLGYSCATASSPPPTTSTQTSSPISALTPLTTDPISNTLPPTTSMEAIAPTINSGSSPDLASTNSGTSPTPGLATPRLSSPTTTAPPAGGLLPSTTPAIAVPSVALRSNPALSNANSGTSPAPSSTAPSPGQPSAGVASGECHISRSGSASMQVCTQNGKVVSATPVATPAATLPLPVILPAIANSRPSIVLRQNSANAVTNPGSSSGGFWPQGSMATPSATTSSPSSSAGGGIRLQPNTASTHPGTSLGTTSSPGSTTPTSSAPVSQSVGYGSCNAQGVCTSTSRPLNSTTTSSPTTPSSNTSSSSRSTSTTKGISSTTASTSSSSTTTNSRSTKGSGSTKGWGPTKSSGSTKGILPPRHVNPYVPRKPWTGGQTASAGRSSSPSFGGRSNEGFGRGGAFPRGNAYGRRSDIRLKEDIVPLERLDNGIGVYRFRYRGNDHTAYVGVMAQEVQTILPDAVSRGRDGYLRVYYDKLGLRFLTWDEWKTRGSTSSATAR